MATEYGAFHLSDNPSAYQPVRTNNFRFLVQGLGGIATMDGEGFINNETYTQDVIDFSVVSFDVPHFSQSEIPINRGNSTVYFAGKATFNSGSLVINDFAGADGKSILEAWQALSYDPVNDSIPSSEVYKKNGTVIEYMPDGKMNRYWELKGCWITKLDETKYDNDSPNKKTVTATIRFDRAIPHKGE